MACRESFDVSMHKCSVQSPRGGFSAGGPDGMSSAMPAHVLNINMEEPVKRKRRQPRKYVPDGSMALALTPVPTAAPLLPGSGGFSHTTEATNTVTSVSADTIKKARVLPKGFGKKLQMLALGSAGVGFTPHVITVKTGEVSYVLDDKLVFLFGNGWWSCRTFDGCIPGPGGKKESKQINDLDSASAPAKLSPGGRSPAGSGPTSRGTLSESSCRPASPLNGSTGTLNNSNRQGFSNMHWK